jgi:site-specific DNA-cytosine methylase
MVQKGKMQTLKTSPDTGVVVNDNRRMFDENDNFGTLGTNCGSSTSSGGGVVVLSNKSNTRCDCLGVTTKEQERLRIRKLTPKECFRLMGVKDEDYERIAKNQSDSSLYHLAGDSIVVNVLMAIFKELIK